jgi:hypothetical protein
MKHSIHLEKFNFLSTYGYSTKIQNSFIYPSRAAIVAQLENSLFEINAFQVSVAIEAL